MCLMSRTQNVTMRHCVWCHCETRGQVRRLQVLRQAQKLDQMNSVDSFVSEVGPDHAVEHVIFEGLDDPWQARQPFCVLW